MDFNVAVPHDLDRPAAKKAADRAVVAYGDEFKQYQTKINWPSEFQAEITFSVSGFSLHGRVDIREKDVTVAFEVPFLLYPVAKPLLPKILHKIELEVEYWLYRAKAGY